MRSVAAARDSEASRNITADFVMTQESGLSQSDSLVEAQSRARIAILVVATLGLVGAAWVFAPEIVDGIHVITQRLGVAGFAVYLAYALAIYVWLGGAWLATSGEPAKRLGLFVWARIVREATSDVLPFSQLGGIVISVNVVSARGVATAVVYASFVADLLTELASQLLFTGVGVVILIRTFDAHEADHLALTITLLGVVGLVALMGLLTSAPSMLGIAQRLARHVLPSAANAVDDAARALRSIYARRGRLAVAFALNCIAWVASAAGAYLVMRLIDVDIPFWRVIALESLIFLLRSTAFMIPAGIGVQEAGYALLGPMIGLPLEAALALALVKRMRDFAIALPVVLIWQWTEARALSSRSIRAPGSRIETMD
jgi:putative membrane protein